MFIGCLCVVYQEKKVLMYRLVLASTSRDDMASTRVLVYVVRPIADSRVMGICRMERIGSTKLFVSPKKRCSNLLRIHPPVTICCAQTRDIKNVNKIKSGYDG